MAKKGDKYERILQAAHKVISEKGFDKTAVSDIVSEAQVAKGTFYLYFDSKAALVPALTESLLQKTMVEIQNQYDNLENKTFEKLIKTIIDVQFKYTNMYKNIILLSYSRFAYEKFFSKWELIYGPYYNWLDAQLRQGQIEGYILEQIDPRHASQIIINLIDQAAERYYFQDQKQDSIDYYKNEVAQFIYRAIGLKR
ncbi:TetR family transcriptional regulator [Bacillus massiliigorillae]|uniref:TetR family transcriptional regulator n=1 Tax=Bacillus massiliigorillae TaxID=1243664 RepID=UPI0003A64AB4|nr:TetR family transcriptional regulator [Bacillus massiliigorillae]